MFTHFAKSKINIYFLVLILIAAILAISLVDSYKNIKKTNYYEQQVRAADTMHSAITKLREHRKELNIPIDENIDPNETGIIGKEFTPLTTTLGNLEAKRTALNPDFAALMVRYFNQIRLQEGDYIGVGASGSFPGLILATLSAADSLNLQPIIIYSVGASMYGANIPDFTFIEMLNHLNQENILPFQLEAVSMGGNMDTAEGLMVEKSKETFSEIAKNADATFIYNESLVDSIKQRIDIYSKASKNSEIKCFVNIGGAVANFGKTSESLSFPNGLVLDPPPIPDKKYRGLIFEYAAQGKPIIHLLNIRELASENGITVDPVPLPKPGESDVYYEIVYNRYVLILSLLVIFLLIYAGFKFKKS